ncbi:MAG: DNA mismatch repair protein MutS, partial [bacterium]
MIIKDKITPLMQQYYKIKEQHKDHILFFRLGDFYEMFGDDAQKAAPILEVALTKRHHTPMCGIPHQAANQYIAKLIKKGLCVAVCEQIAGENAASHKNLFARKVVHTITPGTIVEENLLNSRTNNYLASLYAETSKDNAGRPYTIGIAFSDISTGEFICAEFSDSKGLPNLSTQLSIRRPREIIVPEHLKSFLNIIDLLKNHNMLVHFVHTAKDNTSAEIPERIISPDIEDAHLAKTCCAMLIAYITKTRPQAVDGLQPIRLMKAEVFLQMDETAVRNLELLEGLSSRSREGSLLHVLDYTATSMGARNLKNWILHPLVNTEEIIKRQQMTAYFLDQPMIRADIRDNLKKICDLERTLNRLITGSANARDCNAIKDSLFSYARISSILQSNTNTSLTAWFNAMDAVPEAAEQIQSTIVDSPPISIKEGGIIRPLFNAELDELHDAVSHGKDWLSALEAHEREKTGIPNLKIGYTSVFGYYLEATKSHLSKIPPEYHRKQTLTNAERFITPELKIMEDKILGSESKSNQLEYRIFGELRSNLLSFTARIHRCAETIAILDTFISLAEAAAHNDYNFPDITDEPGIEIVDGRHPVIEKSVREEGGFIPNDCSLHESSSLWIITGPNMSGK